jgi:hypothetical protein
MLISKQNTVGRKRHPTDCANGGARPSRTADLSAEGFDVVRFLADTIAKAETSAHDCRDTGLANSDFCPWRIPAFLFERNSLSYIYY